MASSVQAMGLGVGLALGAFAATAAPLEAYGKLPSIEQAVISPDGTRVAVAVTNGDARAIAIEDLASRQVVTGLRAGDDKVRDIRWAGSDHLLVTLSATNVPLGIEAPRADAKDSMAVILSSPAVRLIDGKPVVFLSGVHFVNNSGVPSLFRIDLDHDTSRLANEASDNTDQWLVGADGQTLVETRYDPKSARWELREHTRGGWRLVESQDSAIGHPEVLGLAADGRSALIEVAEGDNDVVRELAPDAAAWGPPKPSHEDETLIFDAASEALIGSRRLTGDTERYDFVAPADQAAWQAVVALFPGSRVSLASNYENPDAGVTLASMSHDHRKMVVVVDAPDVGPSYYVVDAATGERNWIGGLYDSVNPQDISPVRALAFRAADGLPLTGYLTVPHGKDAKNLPLIVFPHGGPAARDTPGFDWWAQAMASRGYAVLQVNYRGSEGFGWDFLKAGFGEWGRKMQTDLSDGVRYLAGQGIVDPRRVCIVGASYGGYAALAGAALDAGVYRCAVSVAGPSELRRFVTWAENGSDAETGRYWRRYMGADGVKDPHLETISPADRADKVTIPVLLIHGKDDTVVPFEQSQLMLDALKRAGKGADLVVLNREDHWLSRGETRLQMLQATMSFVEKNNPP